MIYICWTQLVLFGRSPKSAARNQVRGLVIQCLASAESSTCLGDMMAISVSTILKFLISIQWLGSNPKWADLYQWRGTLTLWPCLEANCTYLAAIQATNTLRTFMFSTQKRLRGPSHRSTVHHQKASGVILLTWSEIKYIFLVAMTAGVNLSRKLYRATTCMSLIQIRCAGLILSKTKKRQPGVRDTLHVWLVWSNSSYLVDLTAASGLMTFASSTSANSKKMKSTTKP